MKYYSDVTKKIYETEDELTKAELAVDEKKSQREARAKEVETAINEAKEANKKAYDCLSAFCHDYGAYHTSISNVDNFDPFHLFSNFFMF